MLSRVEDHKPMYVCMVPPHCVCYYYNRQFCDHGSTGQPELTDDDVELHRKKRASNNNTELVCLMHLVVDYQFFIKHGQRSVSNTIIYLVMLAVV